MAGEERKTAPDLTRLDALIAEPRGFHLFKALRLVEAVFKDHARFGESRRPSQDPISLGQEPELAFPPSTVLSFSPGKDNRKGHLTNLFFGIYGPHGPLPLHLTEWARDRKRNHRDPTFVAFSNVFHHRMIGLLYRAWASAEPAPNMDRRDKDDLFRKRVQAMVGLKGPALQNRDAMPDGLKLAFSGRLAQSSRNEEGLKAIISHFFEADVELESFVGMWLDLDEQDKFGFPSRRRGRVLGRLGRGVTVGDRIWSRQSKFTVRIGPMGLTQYNRMLPGGESLRRLTAIVRNYHGDAMDWDVNLVLKADEVPRTRLGTRNGLHVFDRLTGPARRGIVEAAHVCRRQGHSHIEPAHWIDGLVAQPDSDLHRIAAHFGMDVDRLSSDLRDALSTLPGGGRRPLELSVETEEAAEMALSQAVLLRPDERPDTALALPGGPAGLPDAPSPQAKVEDGPFGESEEGPFSDGPETGEQADAEPARPSPDPAGSASAGLGQAAARVPVRSGHLILGLAGTRHLAELLPAMSGEFDKLRVDELRGAWREIVGGSPEDPDGGRPMEVKPASEPDFDPDATVIVKRMPKPGELPPPPAADPDATLPGIASTTPTSASAPPGAEGAPDVRETQFRRMLDRMIGHRADNPTAKTGLGWTSWVGARPPGKDADDLRLKPSIDAPATTGADQVH